MYICTLITSLIVLHTHRMMTTRSLSTARPVGRSPSECYAPDRASRENRHRLTLQLASQHLTCRTSTN